MYEYIYMCGVMGSEGTLRCEWARVVPMCTYVPARQGAQKFEEYLTVDSTLTTTY